MINFEQQTDNQNPVSDLEFKGQENQHLQKTTQEIIESRTTQSSGSRLAEYITGLRPDDPRIVERLNEDQKRVRAKYGLPEYGRIHDPAEYERFLRSVAKSLGVTIRSTSDCGSFFMDNPFASGVSFDKDNSVGVDVKKTDLDSYKKSLFVLEHELIHAIQKRDSPRMPTEMREYEAYVANSNVDFLNTNYDPRVAEMFFSFYIGSSVMHHYREQSKEQGSEVLPDWDNPKYFLLKVDNIDEANINDAL